eukprot:TRINITY_DN467_c0_g1_i2.p1 TRINITY_DN467_c0_g1~~TRINITY_DN467_c0_g1_i2.p1  ORF type:complete len:167 (+),score=16.25 TRINITY_DN467_c0_g1_i2:99-599(+)
MARLRPYLCLIFVVCFALFAVQGVAAAWPIVGVGSRGNNVFVVQYLLEAHTYSLDIDGIFGPQTKGRVIAFQAAARPPLTADGIVGEETWPRLIIYVGFGSRGSAVKAVQHLLLYRYGLLGPGGVDGSFGRITRDAVISFQASSGLEQDGIVGPKTWEALVSGVKL